VDINLDVRHPHTPVIPEQLEKTTPGFEELGIRRVS